MRFKDFLRMAILLFAGAATALAAVSVVGAAREDDAGFALVALGWWLAAAAIGLWLGRRLAVTPGISRLLASARTTSTLPELEPGSVLFNRLWPLAVLAFASGGIGFFIPQVPAIATGYAILVALSWRRQAAAVVAVEERDGVQFWVDRSSPFGAPRLLRTPGLRKVEPMAEAEGERAPL
jgi:hypothetical protein